MLSRLTTCMCTTYILHKDTAGKMFSKALFARTEAQVGGSPVNHACKISNNKCHCSRTTLDCQSTTTPNSFRSYLTQFRSTILTVLCFRREAHCYTKCVMYPQWRGELLRLIFRYSYFGVTSGAMWFNYSSSSMVQLDKATYCWCCVCVFMFVLVFRHF